MLTHRGTKPLRTERLTLRRFTLDDAEAMYRNWTSDPVFTRYLTWGPHADADVSRRLVSAWVAEYPSEGYYRWAIEFEGELAGAISVTDASERAEYAEIGYGLSRAHWGQGLMREALIAVMGFLFEEVGLNRVYLMVDAENVASAQVAEKCGLVYEGTLRRHHRRHDGAFADVKAYGILREEWAARAVQGATQKGQAIVTNP